MKKGMFMGTLVLAGVLAISSIAGAHAHRARFSPDQDRVVLKAPEQLDLTFTQEVVGAEVAVLNVNGESVAAGKAQVDPADSTRVTLPLQADLPAGTYTVKWTVKSTDGHTSSGRYQFHIAPRVRRASSASSPTAAR